MRLYKPWKCRDKHWKHRNKPWMRRNKPWKRVGSTQKSFGSIEISHGNAQKSIRTTLILTKKNCPNLKVSKYFCQSLYKDGNFSGRA